MTVLVDALVPQLSSETITVAEKAERLGFDCVWSQENSNDGFAPLPVVADHTHNISFGTRIATAFTRSPMVTAYTAWDLARFSDGRFILGLGTQVKGHNERRYSVTWDSPGPRLREVIESLRHIWSVFQGDVDTLDYDGEYYSLSLMTDTFDPGPIANPDIPIYIAGVNEYNVRLAGEICDGLAMHPFTSPAYAEAVLEPLVAEGAERADRAREDVSLSASPTVITGTTEEERESSREEARQTIAFYASTRTYHDVLEQHGWRSVGETLHDFSKERKWDEMTDHITDEMLATFTVEAPPESLLDEAKSQFGSVADRIVLPIEHGDSFMQ